MIELDSEELLERIEPEDVEDVELPKRKVRSLEDKKLDHEIERDKLAYYLLVGCIVLLFATYLIETFLSQETNDMAKSFFEVLKFLTSSLIGFLFAKRTL